MKPTPDPSSERIVAGKVPLARSAARLEQTGLSVTALEQRRALGGAVGGILRADLPIKGQQGVEGRRMSILSAPTGEL